jgi:hypothetical protein
MKEVFVVHPDGHTSADLIPGARDASTLTHRERGAIGGDPYGADIPPSPPDWEDETTRRMHELEGGGEARERRAPDPTVTRERAVTPPARDEQRNA